RGEPLATADLGFNGFVGDRRLAIRRVENQSGFPWLSASKLRELVLYTPVWADGEIGAKGEVPTHVRTTEGRELPVFSRELADDIGGRHGAAVEMLHIYNGIFDAAGVSIITTDTVREICERAGERADARRFRPNVVVRLADPEAFQEDSWVGRVLAFGEGSGAANVDAIESAPSVAVTLHDIRCSMIGIDPDTGVYAPDVLKESVRANENRAGIYGSIV